MSAIDCDVQEYDSRVRMATQLAASADVSAACIGILDWRRHKLVDGWVGQGRSGAKLGAAEVTNLVSKALAIFLSCKQPDPGLRKLNPQQAPEIEAETWLQSKRYLIGIGERVGDFAPVTALVNTPAMAVPSGLLRLARIGLTYADQIIRDYSGTRRERPEPGRSGIPETILHSLSFGFVVTDANGVVGYVTKQSREWLEDSKEMCLAGGRLAARMPQNQKMLQNALVAATGDEGKLTVVQLDVSDGLPQTLSVLPLGASSGLALVVFRYVSSDGALRDGLLETMGLTVAEQRLARQLLAGKSLADAAAENNLTISTARSYLKRIFAKTGIHRQSQFITLYHTLVPPLLVGSKAALEEPRPDTGL